MKLFVEYYRPTSNDTDYWTHFGHSIHSKDKCYKTKNTYDDLVECIKDPNDIVCYENFDFALLSRVLSKGRGIIILVDEQLYTDLVYKLWFSS